MSKPQQVLISWVAVNNDPFERDRLSGEVNLIKGIPTPGPTLTLLGDQDSPYSGEINDIVLLYRVGHGGERLREERVVKETVAAIRERFPSIQINLERWPGTDPTDHVQIFEFLRERIPTIRRRYAGQELVIHISPGTPAMQTIWLLMVETGLIEPPVKLVKSYRREERQGKPAVIPVELGLETFYKIYRASRPQLPPAEDQDIAWDPAQFQSDALKTLFAKARQYAQINVPILITGERGTGKTTLANWIRLHSPFRREEQDSHWPAVACGQYVTETMRAELFGYRKGAFTGATKDKEGLLATAHGDTLFLDEVGDVNIDLQRLLIKAIEEKRYYPLGDDRSRRSDFRLLAATNLSDHELRHRLAPDFLDRISILTLALPPLREIRADLPWLWRSVYAAAAKRAVATTRPVELTDPQHRLVTEALRAHLLPGNLRDLFRVAYELLAALADAHAPLSPKDAIARGLESLSQQSTALRNAGDVEKEALRAYVEARPLDDVIDAFGRIPTRSIEQSWKSYLAAEIRRISRLRSVKADTLCDVTERALRTWAATHEDGRMLP